MHVRCGCCIVAEVPSPKRWLFDRWRSLCTGHFYARRDTFPGNGRQFRQCYATSTYNGVSWLKSAQKFRSCISFKGQTFHIGFFDSEIIAAHAYDERLRELCDDGARLKKSLNFPSGSEASFRQSPQEARDRGLATHANNARKEDDSFRLLHNCFRLSTQAEKFEVVRVSGASRMDALFKPKDSVQGGLCLQLKSASGRGSKNQIYQFRRTAGYEGMLLILVALDQRLLWAVPGHFVTQKCLSISVGTERDRSWRVSDLGSTLEMYFRQPSDFPHVSMVDARLACGCKNMIEEQAHLLMTTLFAGIGLQLRKSFSTAVVDSVLAFPGQSHRLVRVQEKACSLTSQTQYAINLWKRGGVLGPQAYRDADFDLLLASILHEDRLAGMFAFPVAVLCKHGLVGQKPVRHLLRPPWLPGKKQATRDKYAWQLEYFVDLRGWTGSSELPSDTHARLNELVQNFFVR